jgi:hypothetical protein
MTMETPPTFFCEKEMGFHQKPDLQEMTEIVHYSVTFFWKALICLKKKEQLLQRRDELFKTPDRNLMTFFFTVNPLIGFT